MKLFPALIAACALAGLSSTHAAQLTSSTITEVVRDVKVIKAGTKAQQPARVQQVFAVPDIIRTGADSRAEMIAPDLTVTRIGSNTLFSFSPEKREVNLERGSILFHSPTGKGGGTIKTAAATASVLGTTLIVSTTRNGGFKVLLLEGKGRVTTARGETRNLVGGQMTYMLPGQQLGPLLNFRLGDQVGAAKLVKGFRRELPSIEKIERAVAKQEKAIAKGKLTDANLLASDMPDVAYQVDPSARESLLAGGQAGSGDFASAGLTDAIVEQPALERGRLFGFTAQEAASAAGIDGASTAGVGGVSVFFARNITFATPTVNMAEFAAQDYFAFLSSEDMIFTGPVSFEGLTSSSILAFIAGRNFITEPGSEVRANAGIVAFISYGAAQSAGPLSTSGSSMPLRLESFLVDNTGGSVDIFSTGATEFINVQASASTDLFVGTGTGHVDLTDSTLTAGNSVLVNGEAIRVQGGDPLNPAASFDSPRVDLTARADLQLRAVRITADSADLSGSNVAIAGAQFGTRGTPGVVGIRAVNLLDVVGANFAVADVSMQARTINLSAVRFQQGSTVTLDSEVGALAPNPNSGAPSVPGHVNFISGVQYGSAPAQDQVRSSDNPNGNIIIR